MIYIYVLYLFFDGSVKEYKLNNDMYLYSSCPIEDKNDVVKIECIFLEMGVK